MRQAQGFNGIMLGGAAVLMAVQPAFAAPVQVTAVQLNPTSSGLDVVLQTQNGDRPQVFAVNRGNSWTADVTNSQLRLPGGSSFRQENPTAGISLVTVAPLDANSVRVTVVGQAGVPMGQVMRPGPGRLLFSVSRSGSSQAAVPTPAAPAQAAAPVQATPNSAPVLPPTSPTPTSQPPAPRPAVPQPSGPAPAPLVPNPEITIQGPGANQQPVPPLLPRAIAPPVGDIAAAQIDASASTIDLGTAERVPRLVLRDAPAREVLSLLARAAGLNIAYIDSTTAASGQQQQQQPGAAAAEGPRVTLDIENEAVQDVFNYVLRISGLEANRVGRTIFVGPKLPNTARSVVVRSLRLNQVPIATALNFLVAMGAESAVSRERLVTNVNAVPVAQLAGGGSQSAITQTQTTTETRIETQRVNYTDSTPILRGLQVSGDERTNQVTLVGTPKQVGIAIAQLTQLDVRRRQVVVNVRVVDVNLVALDRASSSFSFGVDQTRFLSTAGIALFNFGRRAPGASTLQADTTGSNIGAPTVPFNTNPRLDLGGFANDFFSQLQAAVSNGNAKVLTDPSLVVQEGQTATVNLTAEVVTNLTQQVTASTGSTQTTITVEKGRAGLILGIKVDRIDDNGFVSLSVAPSISQPDNSVQIFLPNTPGANAITLLSERRLESGQIRLRDGQTLVLSGIIQDQDRATVTKVPILGDIPLLGALFRRTERNNQRREVIVLVTPRILDDSDRSTFGYSYTPGPAARQVLEQADQNRPR